MNYQGERRYGPRKQRARTSKPRPVQKLTKELEPLPNNLPITLYVTTRAIGFGSLQIFSSLFHFSDVPPRGNIYQLYRVALTAFERKVQIAKCGWAVHEDDFRRIRMSSDMIQAIESLNTLPDQLTLPISNVGAVQTGDTLYVPRVGKNNYTEDNRFIPQSEQVTISNLRETVEALSDERTDRDYRRHFYKNNPIPGARWQGAPDDPVLVNADEIIPSGYDWRNTFDDINDIMNKLTFLRFKAPEYCTRPFSYKSDGGKPMLVCNKQEGMRCCDRGSDESLQDYYGRMRIEGHVNRYYNRAALVPREQREGNFCLLGELPVVESLYWPVYGPRDERNCCQYSILRQVHRDCISARMDFQDGAIGGQKAIRKPITLCVTTRAMGFGSMEIFSSLFNLFNRNVPQRGNIYQLYRVALAVFERKLEIATHHPEAFTRYKDDFRHIRMRSDMIAAIESFNTLPEQLMLPINNVGPVATTGGTLYLPAVGKNNYTPDNRFIPQSEQITISNLRETVEALSDERTDRDYRRLFYKNNPIPGARWQGAPDNPVLLNADEIIPRGYDSLGIYDDIYDIMPKLGFLKRKAPEYFTEPISYKSNGGKPMLVCNKQEGLRCCDRGPDESLQDYYGRMRIEGGVGDSYNLAALMPDEQIDGNFCLLGELPVVQSLCWPVYGPRDERNRCQYSSTSYQMARNKIFARQFDRIQRQDMSDSDSD